MSRGGPSTPKAEIYEKGQFRGQGPSSPYNEVALKLLSNPKPYYSSPSNTNTNTSSPETESQSYTSHAILPP